MLRLAGRGHNGAGWEVLDETEKRLENYIKMKLNRKLFYFWAVAILLGYHLFYSSNNLSLFIRIIIGLLILAVIIYFSYLMKLLDKHIIIKERAVKVSVIKIFLAFFSIILILLILSSILEDSSFPSLCLATGQVFFYSALALAEFLAFYGFGNFVLKLFKFIPQNQHVKSKGCMDKLEFFIIAVALGISLVIILMIGLGWLKLYFPIYIWLILALFWIIGFSSIKKLICDCTKKAIIINWSKPAMLKNILWLAIMLVLAIYFINTFKSIYHAEWDTLHTYLLFPKIYVIDHGITDFPFWPHWGFPQNAEMLFVFSWLILNPTLVYIANFFLAILCLLCLIVILRKLNVAGLLYGVALLLLLPIFISLMSGFLKVEILLCFYCLILFNLLRDLFDHPQSNKIYILLAVFSGILLGIKYTNALIIALICLLFIFIYRRPFIIFKKICLYLAIVFVIFSPYLLKNYIYYHQPLYPLFPGKDQIYQQLSVQCQQFFSGHCNDDGRLMMLNAVQKQNGIGDYWPNYFNVVYMKLSDPGPWLLMLLPLLILLLYKKSFLRLLFIFTFVYIFFWLFLFKGQVWYLLPAILSLLIIYSDLLGRKEYKFIDFLLIICLAINIFVGLSSFAFLDSLRYLKGEISGLTVMDLEKHDGVYDWYIMSDYINKLLRDQPDKKVWGAFEPRGYWLEKGRTNFIPDIFGYLSDCLYQQGKLKEAFKKFNVKYLLVFNNPSYVKECDLDSCRSFFRLTSLIEKEQWKLKYRLGDFYLFEL